MKKVLKGAIFDLVNYGGLQIDKYGSGNVFFRVGFSKKSAKRIVFLVFVFRHSSIRLNAMLQTVQFPARITNLNASLTDVYRNNLSLNQSIINTKSCIISYVNEKFFIPFFCVLRIDLDSILISYFILFSFFFKWTRNKCSHNR